MESLSGLLEADKGKYRKPPSIKNGFTQIPNSLLTDRSLSSSEKMVLILFKMHQMGKRSSFPSYRLVGEEIGLSKRHVMVIVKRLIEKGFLLKEYRIGKSNRYKVNF